MTLALIDTSTANIASVRYALNRLGVEPVLASTPEDAAGASKLVLPGVGAAGPAMRALELSGWAEALRNDTRPLLGVCLGMQLLFGESDEDSGAGGPVLQRASGAPAQLASVLADPDAFGGGGSRLGPLPVGDQ